jgi:cytochrome c oxidase subunit I+III
MAGGVAMVILDLALHFRLGRPAPPNPWQADTLEWATFLPPKVYNFASLPPVQTRHPLWEHPELPESIAAGEHGLATYSHGLRETYGSDAITGKPREIFHLPANSWLPLLTALALGVMFVGLLVRVYSAAAVGTVVALLLLLRWSWINGVHPKAAPLSSAEPGELPLHSRTCDGPGLWGMVVALMANATLYLSLLFGWFFLWTVSPTWEVPEDAPIPWPTLLASGILLSGAVGLYHRTAERLKRRDAAGLRPALWLIAVLGLVHAGLLVWILLSAPLRPTDLAHDAILTVMLLYLLIHGGLAVILTVMQSIRAGYGYVGADLPYEAIVLRPFWVYTLGIFWLAFAAFILLPMAWSGA